MLRHRNLVTVVTQHCRQHLKDFWTCLENAIEKMPSHLSFSPFGQHLKDFWTCLDSAIEKMLSRSMFCPPLPPHIEKTQKTYPIFIFDLPLQLCVGLSLLLQLILEEFHLVHQRLFLVVQLSAAHHGSLVLVFQGPQLHPHVAVFGGEAVAHTFTGFITTPPWPRRSCGYLLPCLENQHQMG